MKNAIIFFLIHTICLYSLGQNNATSAIYKVPDSIKVAAFYAEIKISSNILKKRSGAGISANGISLYLGKENVSFNYFAKPGHYIAFGKDTDTTAHAITWNFNWLPNETYPLLIATASDSSANKTLYSGYIFLPGEKKWKLIATRSYNDTVPIKYLRTVNYRHAPVAFSNRWLQRSNGTWKALDAETAKPPSLRQMSNIDGIVQQQLEVELLRSKLPKDSIVYEEGMFYQTLKDGNGKLVKVTDTLTVHYRGSLFSDGSVFDETKDKPATFPLERLIKGWQTGLVHCRVGGKMRLYLPSGSAYGIRTRSAEIPPNSILVFDVEVMDAKEKVAK